MMLMILSSDPIQLSLQLSQLLERSHYFLTLLTSPIELIPEGEYSSPSIVPWGKDKTRFDYDPPKARFASLRGISFSYLYEQNNTT